MKKSNYDEIDFNKLYMEQRKKSVKSVKNKDDWDKKASSFGENALKSDYADDFLNSVDFGGVSSVLDFACGAGALSIKAAKFADQIYAYDFSPKMLEFLGQILDKLGIKNVKFAQKAFEDSWEDVPVCDIVFASRCLEVDDLKATLEKLISKAKKRVYMTFKAEGSFVDKELLQAMKREVEPKPTYVYLLNILAQMGYLPNLKFIKASSCSLVTNADELIQKVTWGLNEELSSDEKEALIRYFNSGKKAYNNPMVWALIWIDL